MLEHCSHIRIDAKPQALDAAEAAQRSTSGNGDVGHGDNGSGGNSGTARPERNPEFSMVCQRSPGCRVTVTSQSAVGGVSPVR